MTAPFAIRRLNAADPDFGRHLDHLLSWESASDDSVNQRVLDIIAAVRSRGDAAGSSSPSASMVSVPPRWPT